MSKHLRVPEKLGTISVPGMAQKIQLDLEYPEFLKVVINAYPELVKTLGGIRQGEKVFKVIEESKEEIVFEDADYNMVKEALNAALQNSLWKPPVIVRALAPFIEHTLEGATGKSTLPPEKEKKPEELLKQLEDAKKG